MTNQLGIKPFKDLEPTAVTLPNGTVAHSGPQFRQVFQDFWSQLCTKPPLSPEEKTRETHYQNYVNKQIDKDVHPIFDHEFTRFELHTIIKNTPKRKAPGPPGHTYEFIKLLWDISQDSVLTCINHLFNNNLIPQNWCLGAITLLYKKGDKLNPANYRPITLINAFWKIIMRALDKRITSFLESNNLLAPFQNGFRKSRNCQDHIATLQEVIGRRKRMDNVETYVSYYDLRKAYDTVWQEGLWYKMAKMGIRGKTLRFIMTAYQKSTSCIRLRDGFTTTFDVTRGVRQGDPLAPTLFNIYINDILDKAPNHITTKIYLTQRRNIHETGFLFADDLATVTESEHDNQVLCSTINEWCTKWRMSLNAPKCMILKAGKRNTKNNPDPSPVSLDNHNQIDPGDSYKYLGIHFQKNGAFSTHAQYLKSKLEDKLQFFTRFFKNRIIPSIYQRLLIKERLISCITYAIESWGNSKTIRYEIQKVINKAIRSAFGLGKRASVTAIMSELDIPSVDALFKQQQVAFAIQWNSNTHLGAHEYYRHPITDADNPRSIFCPISAAQTFASSHNVQNLQNISKDQKTNIIRGFRSKFINDDLMNDIDSAHPTHSCSFYYDLKQLEEKQDQSEIPSDTDTDNLPSPSLPPNNYSLPKYFNHKQKINKEWYMVDAKITNTILKLRTGIYPFMRLFKHHHPELSLTNNCPLCPLNKTENLHHILYECPAYSQHTSKLILPTTTTTDPSLELLLDSSLTNFSPGHPNMLKIYELLQLRWSYLSSKLSIPHSGESPTIMDGLTPVDLTTSIG